jgi:acyl-CoA synthetase (NDP forming)
LPRCARSKGTFGLVSQSGALGYCVLQAMERGIGFSHYLSPGNSCDVDVCDLINYLVDDEATKVIGCVVEGRPGRQPAHAGVPARTYRRQAALDLQARDQQH